MTLTCEERERRIFDWLFSGREALLRRYSKPERLSEEQARLEVTDMVRDINGDIPATIGDAALAPLLERVAREVRRRHGAQHWPTVKVLLSATKDAVDATHRDIAEANSDKWEPCPYAINAKRLQSGEPVGDGFLWGRDAVEMVKRGLVTEDQLDQRRRAHVTRLRGVYTAAQADRTVADLERRHADAVGAYANA